MAREWKPGDVALRVAGLHSNRQVAVRVPACTNATSPLRDRPHWHFATDAARVGQCGSDEIAEYRPLLVLDPDDDEQMEQLAKAAGEWEARIPYDDVREEGDLTPATAMAAAIRSLLDPKPAEPQGLGAVVRDRDGTILTQVNHGCWVRKGDGLTGRTWDEFDATEVLSEGVQS